MTPFIEKYFTPQVISDITKSFGIEFSDLKLLRDNVNLIYAYRKSGSKFILRITHSSVQKLEELQSEVDWLHFLQKNDANVSAPIESLNGNLIEVIKSEDTYFTVTVYTEAKGKKIDRFNWNEPVFKEIGRVTGQLHRITKDYKPGSHVIPRSDFVEPEVARVMSHKEVHDEQFTARMLKLVDTLSYLPRTREHYGLIHNDINRGNMFIHNGRICLFDTADCAYSWFVADIALTLLYVVQYFQNDPNGKLTGHIRYFMDYYWEGYQSENKIADEDLKGIPLIMTLRSIFIYDHLCTIWKDKKLNHAQQNFFNILHSFSHETFDFIGMELIKP